MVAPDPLVGEPDTCLALAAGAGDRPVNVNQRILQKLALFSSIPADAYD
jgi:hypothetical protein